MKREEKFRFDIANLKSDFAIENMNVNEEDVTLLKKYYDKEITMNEVIDSIKNEIIN